MISFVGFILALVVVFGAEQAVVRGVKAVLLSFRPLSGDVTDSIVYDRSVLTPGSADNRWIWAGLMLCALSLWAAFSYHLAWLAMTFALLTAVCTFDVWTWDRCALSVRRVSWRRGWKRSVRSVPVSQVAEVSVVEKAGPAWAGPLASRLGVCYLRLKLHTGDAVKLPRTSALTGAARLEDAANFLRLQMALAEDERQREKRDKRAKRAPGAADPEVTPDELELRRKLAMLRKAAAERASSSRAGSSRAGGSRAGGSQPNPDRVDNPGQPARRPPSVTKERRSV